MKKLSFFLLTENHNIQCLIRQMRERLSQPNRSDLRPEAPYNDGRGSSSRRLNLILGARHTVLSMTGWR